MVRVAVEVMVMTASSSMAMGVGTALPSMRSVIDREATVVVQARSRPIA